MGIDLLALPVSQSRDNGGKASRSQWRVDVQQIPYVQMGGH